MSVDGRDEPLGGANEPGAGRPRHGGIPSQGGPGRPRAGGAAGEGRQVRQAKPAVPPQRGARTGTDRPGGAPETATRAIGLPPSDAELLKRLRDGGVNGKGDISAYEELFRRHSKAVRRYARTCCRDEHTAEDLTAEVFARTWHAVRVGAGPEHAVRAYLLTAVRRVAADWARTAKREQLIADFADFIECTALADQTAQPSPAATSGPHTPGADVRAMQAAERSLALRAFRSLPERWQAVLWHTAVEEESPGAVAPLFGLSANATAVLANRAREGLRQAYLQAHVSASLTSGGDCAQYADRLGAYARGRLRMRAERGLRRHLEECSRCRLAAGELEQVNAGIPAVVPVAVIGWFAAGYSIKVTGLAAGGVASAGAVGTGVVTAGSGAGGVVTTGVGTGGGTASGGAGGVSGACGASGAAPGSAAVAEGLAAPVKAGLAAVAAGAAATAALVWALSSAFPEVSRPSVRPGPVAKPPAAQPVVPEVGSTSPQDPVRPAEPGAASPARKPPFGPVVRHEPATVPKPRVAASVPEPATTPQTEPAPTPSPSKTTPAPPAPSEPAATAQPPAPDPGAVYQVNRLPYRTFGHRVEPEITVGTGSWLWQRWGMSIDGTRYGHGISVRARSSIAIDLNRSCRAFEAVTGVDDSTLGRGAVRFSVYGDGTRLWQSPVLRRGDTAVPVNLAIAGHGTIRLVVEPQTAVGSVAMADWALARISCP
ncbi:sigma-70 family RNA polymerase sigma factor [Streptomyces sp. SCSIO 30461]|uniref:sigma-70 family RNA polymerase sigma factor n=1 Tax=Streptomyces sp. SCSIO 30461 TaxID=3118085 RepID=UPI0030D35E91